MLGVHPAAFRCLGLSGIVCLWLAFGAAGCGGGAFTPQEVTWAGLTTDVSQARFRTTMHLAPVSAETVPGNAWFPETTWYWIPLFADGDVHGREVRAVLRTRRPLEKGVAYEYGTVEGRVSRLTPVALPADWGTHWKRNGGYTLSDDAVLIDAVRVEVDGQVWVEP